MKAYSEDLRIKIVEAVERGTSKSEAARAFGVGLSPVKRYVATACEGGSLVPKKRPGSRPKIGGDAKRLLEADLEERPAATLSFSKFRGLIRKAEARTWEALIEAMGRALDAVTDRDARGPSGTAVTVRWVNCYDSCSRVVPRLSLRRNYVNVLSGSQARE